jgi:hypothetical protein
LPGPDYPWATWLSGHPWRPRPNTTTIAAVVLHARPLPTPDDVAALLAERSSGYHYIVLRNGAILQLAPDRGWMPHCYKITRGSPPDHRTIAICLDGAPDQPSWPPDQVTSIAHVLSITYSVRGHLPVRDAGTIAAPLGRIPQLTSWPWLDMQRAIIRLDTPLHEIYNAMLDATLDTLPDLPAPLPPLIA